MKQSNPIQQRMDILVEKWEAVAAAPGINIVRIHAEENEKTMVDAFYTYLLGIDTDNHDVPVIFESIYHSPEQYSEALLDELAELIRIWNHSNKDALNIKTEPLNWQPDYKLLKKDNPAYLFTENMNRLAAHLALPEKVFLVAILKVSFVQPAHFNHWLEDALKAGIHPKCKILIDDAASHPFYERIAAKYPEQIATLIPGLDMDNAMQQLAAMGNPNDAGVQYRQAFMKLMQAIEKRQEKEAEKHAAACLAIAEKNLAKNPYWIGQYIAIYAALANDQVGHRNFKKAIAYSTKAVESAEQSKQLVNDEFVYRKFVAQSLMMRGAMYAADKDWLKAVDDFNLAATHYVYTNDTILALEAYRMTGYACHKTGNDDAACKALVEALDTASTIPPNMVQLTTFAGVVELLLTINNGKYISRQEIEEDAETVYGKEWVKEIMNWKNPQYKQVTNPADTVVA